MTGWFAAFLPSLSRLKGGYMLGEESHPVAEKGPATVGKPPKAPQHPRQRTREPRPGEPQDSWLEGKKAAAFFRNRRGWPG